MTIAQEHKGVEDGKKQASDIVEKVREAEDIAKTLEQWGSADVDAAYPADKRYFDLAMRVRKLATLEAKQPTNIPVQEAERESFEAGTCRDIGSRTGGANPPTGATNTMQK